MKQKNKGSSLIYVLIFSIIFSTVSLSFNFYLFYKRDILEIYSKQKFIEERFIKDLERRKLVEIGEIA